MMQTATRLCLIPVAAALVIGLAGCGSPSASVAACNLAVSYTHLTLPTIYSV